MTYQRKNNRYFIITYDTFIRLTFSPNIMNVTSSPHLIYFKVYIEYDYNSSNTFECKDFTYIMYDVVTSKQILDGIRVLLQSMHKEELYIDKLLSAVSLIDISYDSLFEIGL